MILALSPPCARSGSKEPWAPGGTSDGGEGAGCDSSGDREVARRVAVSSLPGSRRRMSQSREVFQDPHEALPT